MVWVTDDLYFLPCAFLIFQNYNVSIILKKKKVIYYYVYL